MNTFIKEVVNSAVGGLELKLIEENQLKTGQFNDVHHKAARIAYQLQLP